MNRHVRCAVLVFAGVLIALAPGVSETAWAQGTGDLERAKAALPARAARSLERVVTTARSRGIPTEPLIDKALEGAAKNVAPDRIIAVVQRLADQLEHARSLLSDGPTTALEITAVADALQRGIPDDAVRALRRDAKKEEPIGQAVHVLADLLDQGVPVDRGIEVLDAWRGQGARSDQLRELPIAVERLIREGVMPERAAAAVTSAIRAGREPGNASTPGANAPGKAKGKGKQSGKPESVPIAPGKGKGKGKGQGNKPGA